MNHIKLLRNYPPSVSCDCGICKSYCKRPGWWSVEQAELAINELANRMMLEVSPEFSFVVLSPAFSGNECKAAQNIFAKNGCNFLKEGLCELHSTKHIPLECSFCHHERVGLGIKCHSALESNWHTNRGQRLARSWCNIVGYTEGLDILKFISKA
jgi:hypothetical protein